MNDAPSEARANPLLGLLRRQPRAEPGQLVSNALRAEWDGEHLTLTRLEEGAAAAAEPVRLVAGEPVGVVLSATEYALGGPEVAERFGTDAQLLHQLHAELHFRGETLRFCAPAPPEVVGDLPLRSAFGEEVDLDPLIGLLRQLSALGANLRVPHAVTIEGDAPPGLEALGAGHQRELASLWKRARSEPFDLEVFQRLEIIYGANGLWRAMCALYDAIPHPHGRARLVGILERVSHLYDNGPELSHLWLTIGLECEAAERLDQARFAYFRSFKAWAQNVAAVEAKLQLERRTGNLTEYRKMLAVRRKLLLGYAGATVAYLKLALELLNGGQAERAEYLVRLAARLPATERRRRTLEGLVGWVTAEPERALDALHQLTDGFFEGDAGDDHLGDDSEDGEPVLRLVTSVESEDDDDGTTLPE